MVEVGVRNREESRMITIFDLHDCWVVTSLADMGEVARRTAVGDRIVNLFLNM